MIKPCHCAEYNPTCQRAGHLMNLREWELCSGKCPEHRPCPPPHNSEAYRATWDKLYSQGCKWCVFLHALLRHACDWFNLVDTVTYRHRINTCKICVWYIAHYSGGRCAKCGCAAGNIVALGDSEEPPPWHHIFDRIAWRWRRLWGKAWYRSEDCPVCHACGKTKQEECNCQPFVSKWRSA